MDNRLPDFYLLEDALLRLDADFSASECHGIASAMLAVDIQRQPEAWLPQVIQGEQQDIHFQEACKLLMNLFFASKGWMENGDFAYPLLLPDDEASADLQVEALQKWCQGFAMGLALSGLTSLQDLPADSLDWVQDLIKIGASGELDLSDEGATEQALEEIKAFLRVGVLLMHEELQPLTGSVASA